MKKISTISLMALGLFSVSSLSVNAQAFTESFEGGVPPSGWTISNPDGMTTFAAGSVGKTGSSSAFIDVFNQTSAEQGEADALITGTANLALVALPTLSFQRAYQMYTDPATPYIPADQLSVYISTDGGVNWILIYSKSGTDLITANTQFDGNNGFVPTNSEWAMEMLSLSAYSTATTAQFKFEFINDWENNFYLDDIMVSVGSVGVNEVNLDEHVNVFPNPSQGNVNVDLAAFGLGQTDVVIYNMVGEEVERTSHNSVTPKRVRFNLENQPNGVYFVKVRTENGISTKKLVLNK